MEQFLQVVLERCSRQQQPVQYVVLVQHTEELMGKEKTYQLIHDTYKMLQTLNKK